MKIQGINCSFNRDEWIQNINSAFIGGSVVDKGHAYLYLDKQGKCKKLPSQTAHQRDHWKLTIDDIIRISQQFFNDTNMWKSSETATMRDAFDIMDKGAQTSFWSRLIHWLRGLGFKTTHTLIEEQKILVIAKRIETKYEKLFEMLKNYTGIAHAFEDPRFEKDCEAFAVYAKDWSQTYEHSSLQNYQDWKNEEDSLANFSLKVKQMLNFSEQALLLSQQIEKLEKLVKIHMPSSIQMNDVDNLKKSFKELIDDMFDQYKTNDEEEQKNKFEDWNKSLENWIEVTVEDYALQPTYDKKAVQEILQPANAHYPTPLKKLGKSKNSDALDKNANDEKIIPLTKTETSITIEQDDIWDDESLNNAIDNEFYEK